eukprot:gene5049-8645_t
MSTEVKKKKPFDNMFTQQRMPAWQPVLSPPWVIALFLIIFIVFTPLGVFILLASQGVQEISHDYTDTCAMTFQNDTFGNPIKTLGKQCKYSFSFNVETRMEPPIYIYYHLDNFYQNHRRYANSRNDYQLQGLSRGYSNVQTDCTPILGYPGVASNDSLLYNPCGLIAWSMFNDTFVLKKKSGVTETVICNGPNPTLSPSKCSKDEIAWLSDRQYKFKPAAAGYMSYPNSYYNESGHIIPQTNDTDLMVWMRTAALPNFRKLYRIVSEPLNAGTYVMDIVQNYPVSSFNGKKRFIITTTSWIGGKNIFLAVCYLVIGGLCLILALLFGISTFIYTQIKNKKS